MKQIPILSKEWTDFNYHDPGITMLQMFSWLKELQQYYMSAVSSEHLKKYLALLGGKRKEYVPARAYMGIDDSGGLSLLRGERFYAGDMVFETASHGMIHPVRILDVYVKSEAGRRSINEILSTANYSPQYLLGSKASAGSCLKLVCYGEVSGKFSLYFKLFEEYPVKRNPVTFNSKNKTPVFAELEWEIETEGKRYRLEVLQDETNGFIQSGIIRFRCRRKILGNFKIAAALKAQEYDVAPMAYYVKLNPVLLLQQTTLCAQITYGNKGIIYPKEELFRYGSYLVLAEGKKGFYEAVSYEEILDDSGIRLGIRLSDLSKPEVRMVFYDERYLKLIKIKYTDLSSSLHIVLEKKGILAKNLKVHLLNSDDAGRVLWTEIFPFPENKNTEEESIGYYFNSWESRLCIGKYVEGVLYEVTFEYVFITSLCVTEGEKGNIPLRSIEYKDYKTELFTDGFGGVDGEDVDEAVKNRILRLKKPYAAATLCDYEQLVEKTEGLMLRKVKAFRETDPCYGNVVSVVVIPYSEEERPVLPDLYRRQIEEKLMKHRQIASVVRVLSPRYFGVQVFLTAYLKSENEAGKKEIQEFFKNYFDFGHRELGQALLYEHVYQGLERLEGIAFVERLVMIPDGREGLTVAKNGDIFVCGQGFVYLKKLELILKNT